MHRRSFLWGLGAIALTARFGYASSGSAHHAALGVSDDAVIPLRFEEQVTVFSCGLACLVSVMEYWGTLQKQYDLLDAHPPRNERTGYSMGELKTIAEGQSARAYCLQGEYGFVKQQIAKRRPLIMPLLIPYNEFGFSIGRRLGRRLVGSYSHFVAVCAIANGKVLLMNPLQGLHVVEESRFVDMWEKKQRSMLLVTA